MRYAISDIHGCARTFNKLLEHIHLSKEDELYLLGDYIDRGKDSKGVIDTILDKKKEGYNIRCLRGNHEQLLLLGLQGDDYMLNIWQRNGGLDTLNSYGIYDPEKIPEEHYEFFKSTEFFFELPDYILVHAGLNFELTDFREDRNAMMWVRKFDMMPEKTNHRPLIHGHTPISFQEMLTGMDKLPQNFRMDIDNGCVYTGRKGCGGLVALDLDARILHRVENCD